MQYICTFGICFDTTDDKINHTLDTVSPVQARCTVLVNAAEKEHYQPTTSPHD